MTSTIFNRRIAGDAFEHMIENQIVSPADFYDLDGETFLRTSDGRIETGTRDIFEGGA